MKVDLVRLPFFADAPPGALAPVAAVARWVSAAPERIVMDFEDPTTDVFFVIEGRIRVLVHTADGAHTRIFGDFMAGDLVGELSAIDGAPRSARVETLVTTHLCIVPGPAFLQAVHAVPILGLRLLRLLSMRVRLQNRLLLEHSTLPTRLRLIAELLRQSRVRLDGTAVISPPPMQEELANRIGARRETVARELGALSRAGLLRRSPSAMALPDPGALERLLSADAGM